MQDFRKKILEDIKKDDLEKNIPSISFEVAEFLAFFIKTKNAKKILEVGTAHAYSTIWLGDSVEKLKGTLTTVDRSELSLTFAKQNIEKAGLEKTVNIIYGNALEVLPELERKKEKFDFIFIDAQKSLTLEFFKKSEKLLEENGIIVVDDVLKFKEKMSHFWEYIEKNKSWEFIKLRLDKDDEIALFQKV